jgi:hypothetical protein
MALTGRFDFKKTFMGKIVLLVEEEVPSFWSRKGERSLKKRWRNATLMDLTSTELRILMDARHKPYLLVHRLDVERMAAVAADNVVPLQHPGMRDVHPPPKSAPGASVESRMHG